MSVLVREAEETDFGFILDALEDQSRIYSESLKLTYQLFEDELHVEALLYSLKDNGILLVAENGGQLVGFIAGWISPHPYNPRIRVATHASWWVLPEKRKGRSGAALLNAFAISAKAKCCDQVIVSLAVETPIRESSMKRMGYTPADKSYVMEV